MSTDETPRDRELAARIAAEQRGPAQTTPAGAERPVGGRTRSTRSKGRPAAPGRADETADDQVGATAGGAATDRGPNAREPAHVREGADDGPSAPSAESAPAVRARSRAHVRGKPTYASRFALDAANSRLRRALAKLADAVDPDVQDAGDRIGAEIVAAIELAAHLAEQAHPPTRDRLRRIERKAERARQAISDRQGGA